MKKFSKIFLLPFIISVSAILLFFITALIPQNAIQYNAELSAKQLLTQGQWETVINKGDPTYTLDIYTDSQIFMQSYNMNMDDPSSIFKNPKHISEKQDWNMAVAFNEVVNEDAVNETSYSRYWMGFRLIIRPLLLIADYFTIRKLTALIFYLLLFLTVGCIGKRFGCAGIICFGLPMAMMNPAVISHSLQFTCTFILSFIFILFLLFTDSKKYNVPLLFCAFGALTQLFDFYTTPLITFALPVILLLTYDSFKDRRWSTTLKALASWAYGYASMWIIKMLYVTLFTDINGFAEAFKSFAGRVGITQTAGLEDKYNAVEALRLVYNKVFTGTIGNIIFLMIVLACAAAITASFITQSRKEFLSNGAFLFIATLPLIWFVITAQPIVIHHWFQYRTIIVTFCSIFVYYVYAFSKIPLPVKKTNG